MFHHHPFVLVLTLSFSLFSFHSLHWTSSYIAIFSTLCPLLHSKPIHSLTSNLNTGLIIVRCRAVCCQVNLNFTCFSLFFPCLLTLVHKVQTVPVDSEPYKYHHPASLNSRQLWPTSPLFSLACPSDNHSFDFEHVVPPFFNFATHFSYVPVLTHTALTFKRPSCATLLGRITRSGQGLTTPLCFSFAPTPTLGSSVLGSNRAYAFPFELSCGC